jgi:hypothetical protein
MAAASGFSQRRRLPTLAALLVLVMLWILLPAQSALADHCGALGTVHPEFGTPGTTYIFRTNLGEPSTVRLFHDGELVRTIVDADGQIALRIHTGVGDEGAWTVKAAITGDPVCSSTAHFTVGTSPETDTQAPVDNRETGGQTQPWVVPLLLMGMLATLRLTRRRGSPSQSRHS